MSDEGDVNIYRVEPMTPVKDRKIEALRRALGRAIHGMRRAVASRFKKLEDFPTRVDGKVVPDQYDIGYSTALQELDPLLREAADEARRELDALGLDWASEEELLPPVMVEVRVRGDGEPCAICGVPILKHGEDGHLWEPRYESVPSKWNAMAVGTWVRSPDNVVGQVIERHRTGADGVPGRASVTVRWMLSDKSRTDSTYRVSESTLEQIAILPGKPIKGRLAKGMSVEG